MHTTPFRPTARRLALLTAALLHLLGASVLPALHAWKVGAGAFPAAVAVAEREPGQPGAPAHDELHCALCHAHGTVALPAPGAELPGTALAAEHPVRDAEHLTPHRPASPARARGPPLHS
ncbi:MAG TPA: hypothetical protein VFQ45_20745 [Longimicrobium sp.]|nr:hypothetical protein [Longimicrobium sp.]